VNRVACPAPRRLASFALASVPGSERVALMQVADSVAYLNLPPQRLNKLKTAVAEVTMNAIEHGNDNRADLAVDPAGNVWVMNNWQDIDSCFGVPDEVLSTRCGGQGVTIFYGMAKPVRAPQIGPSRPADE